MHKKKLVWIQGLTCNGNSHALLSHPYLDSFLEDFELLYHPLLPCKYTFKELYSKNIAIDVLLVEGAVSDDKKHLMRFERSFTEIFMRFTKRAKHLIAVGSCASFGGVFRQKDPENIAGLLYANEEKNGFLIQQSFSSCEQKLINLSGCPVNPLWLVDTLYAIKDNHHIVLDEQRRPKEVYAYFTHHGCTKNEYFEWKVDCKSFGQKEGCLYYDQGCRGPLTRSSCNKTLWNGVSSKTRAGGPCLGCTEFSFPEDELFRTKTYMSLPTLPPAGVSKRAYYTLAGVAKSFKIERLLKKLTDEEQ